MPTPLRIANPSAGRSSTKNLAETDLVAADPVYRELVSGPDSQLTGKNTGNSLELGASRLFRAQIATDFRPLTREFPARRNREFQKPNKELNRPEQGITE